METLRKNAITKTMKILAFLFLFLGTIAVSSSSLLLAHQPKCPEDLLK